MDKSDYFDVGDAVRIKGIDELYQIRDKRDDIFLLVDQDGDEMGYFNVDLLELD